MYTIRDMPRPKPSGPTDNFQFRLKADEYAVWDALWQKASARVRYLSKTMFNRILVGLEDDPNVVTAQDRALFYAASKGKPELIGAAPPARARIRQVPTKKERARR